MDMKGYQGHYDRVVEAKKELWKTEALNMPDGPGDTSIVFPNKCHINVYIATARENTLIAS